MISDLEMNIFNVCQKQVVKNVLHLRAIVDGVSFLKHVILASCKIMNVKICARNGYLMKKENAIKDRLVKYLM